MQELTQEQTVRLQSFAEQRDVLQAEVTELTREKDSLLSVNKELTGTNSQLVSEIGEHKAELQNFTKSVAAEIDAVAKQQVKEEKALAKIEAKKEIADAELTVLTRQLKKIKEILDSINTEAEDINSNLRSAHGKVNVFLASVKESADDIVASSTNVKNATSVFTESIAKEYATIAKLRSDLDKREILLNGRETAINELVEDYKKNLPTN